MLALAPIDTNKLKIITVLEESFMVRPICAEFPLFFQFFFFKNQTRRIGMMLHNKTKQNKIVVGPITWIMSE